MHTSRPVNTKLPLVIAYPASGPDEGYPVLHKAGCSHSLRASTRDGETPTFDPHAVWGADDFFMVAPCAAVKGSKRGLSPVVFEVLP